MLWYWPYRHFTSNKSYVCGAQCCFWWKNANFCPCLLIIWIFRRFLFKSSEKKLNYFCRKKRQIVWFRSFSTLFKNFWTRKLKTKTLAWTNNLFLNVYRKFFLYETQEVWMKFNPVILTHFFCEINISNASSGIKTKNDLLYKIR